MTPRPERTQPSAPRNRRRRSLRVGTGAVLLAAALGVTAWLVPVLPLDQDELTVTFTQGGGVVESADGSRAELSEGSTVGTGDRVVIPQGASLSLDAVDGHRITLTDTSSLAVEGGKRSLVGGRMRMNIGVPQGEVRVSGEGHAGSSMEIGLPNGVAGVRGTDVSVTTRGDRAAVSLHDGSVSLKKTPGSSVELSPGEGAVLTADGPIVSPLPVPPALRGLPTGEWVVRSPDATVTWGPVAGATSYLLQLATDTTFQTVEYFGRTDSTSIALPVLDTEEALFGRVQGVTEDGLKGLPSSHFSLRMAFHWAQALSLREGGNVRASLDEFQIALERQPDNPDLLRDFGWSYYLLGQHRRAREIYEQARELAPGDVELLVELARIDFWLKDYDEAERIYKEVLQANPRYADALWGLGDTYRVLGRRQEALDLVQRALQVEPDHPYARATLRELRSGG